MRVLALIATLTLACTPARADWQNTKWGMTVDEAVAATGATLGGGKLFDGDNFEVLAFMAYEAVGLPFTAMLRFSRMNYRLIGVSLHPQDPSQCFEIQRKLEDAYGKPARTFRDAIQTQSEWLDPARGNTILWSRVGVGERTDVCTVVYSELAKPGAKGGL